MKDMKSMKMDENHVLTCLDRVHRTGRVHLCSLFPAISFTPFLFFMVKLAAPWI